MKSIDRHDRLRAASARAGMVGVAVVVLTACAPSSRDDSRDMSSDASTSSATSAAVASRDVGSASTVDAAVTSGSDVDQSMRTQQTGSSLPPARDVEQDFLRRMLDHHEMLLTTLHSQMMQTRGHAAHGTKVDPAEWDARLDAEKSEMLRLLKAYYQEEYSPSATGGSGAPAGKSRVAGPPSSMPGMPASGASGPDSAEAEMAGLARLATQLREGAALVERYQGRLKRPEVQAVARHARLSQLTLARAIGSAAQ